MHILIIPSWFKTPSKPISGSFFEEQARMLMKNGHQVGILSPQWSGSFIKFIKRESFEPLEDYIDNGLPINYVPSHNIVPRWRNINYLYVALKAKRKFKEYIQQYGKPDIIHAHSTFIGGITAFYLSKWFDIPYFLTEHSSPMVINGGYNNKLDINTICKVFNHSVKNFAVSENFKQLLIDRYNLPVSRMAVLNNLFSPIFSDKFIPRKYSTPFKTIAIGHINKNKNFELLIDATAIVIEKGYEVQVTIAGEGHLLEELKQKVKSNALESFIQFIGSINRSSIKKEIDKSHLLISTSSFETFGVTLIEALASGRPVIATDSGGPRDIITKKNGLLVTNHTPSDVANAIINVIDKYDSFSQEEIRQDCIDRFSEEAIYSKLIEFYKEA